MDVRDSGDGLWEVDDDSTVSVIRFSRIERRWSMSYADTPTRMAGGDEEGKLVA